MGERLTFPFAIRDLTDEEKKILSELNESIDMVKFIGNRTCIPSEIRELEDIFYNFKPRPDDIWLIGFPRSGTTLTQEILYLLGNDLDYEKAASEIMDYRFPMLHTGLHRFDAKQFENCEIKEKLTIPPHELLEQTKEKRFIKSHFGLSFIHPDLLKIGCKVVFIARNPKDALNSLAYYPDNAKNPKYTFKRFWKTMKYDLAPYGNYFEMLQEAWEKRNEKNLLILFYEDVNADKKGALLKIADFLGKKLTDDELDKLLNHLQIDNFKNNKSLNNDHLVDAGFYVKDDKFSFIRKGKTGGWRDGIPQELIGEIDDWVKENLAKIPDFEIPKCWQIAMDLK